LYLFYKACTQQNKEVQDLHLLILLRKLNSPAVPGKHLLGLLGLLAGCLLHRLEELDKLLVARLLGILNVRRGRLSFLERMIENAHKVIVGIADGGLL
jgi:hypothetical protein